MDIDLFLKQYNLTYEELNPQERETFHAMYSAFETSELTISKLREYITSMRASVEQELTRFDLGSNQDLFLKARLRNYMLLEAFLDTPEKAKKQLEIALKGVKGK